MALIVDVLAQSPPYFFSTRRFSLLYLSWICRSCFLAWLRLSVQVSLISNVIHVLSEWTVLSRFHWPDFLMIEALLSTRYSISSLAGTPVSWVLDSLFERAVLCLFLVSMFSADRHDIFGSYCWGFRRRIQSFDITRTSSESKSPPAKDTVFNTDDFQCDFYAFSISRHGVGNKKFIITTEIYHHFPPIIF